MDGLARQSPDIAPRILRVRLRFSCGMDRIAEGLRRYDQKEIEILVDASFYSRGLFSVPARSRRKFKDFR